MLMSTIYMLSLYHFISGEDVKAESKFMDSSQDKKAEDKQGFDLNMHPLDLNRASQEQYIHEVVSEMSQIYFPIVFL